MPRHCFWDRYWGRAGQLLVNFFPLSLVTVTEVFAKVNSDQFLNWRMVAELQHCNHLCVFNPHAGELSRSRNGNKDCCTEGSLQS